MFDKHVEEDGNVYYTLGKKAKDGEPPKQLDADTLFEMPDLVLDLDAAGSNHVRESTQEDVAHQISKWKASEKQLSVRKRMKQLAVALGLARSNALQVTLTPTHPMHIADQDIMSAALRGVMDSEKKAWPPQQVEVEAPSNRLVITALSQRHRDLVKDRFPDAAKIATPPTQVEDDGIRSKLGVILGRGDPRRRPDYMRQLRISNGISSSAMEEDETLIRWLLLRDDNNSFVKKTCNHQPPTVASVISAIAKVAPKSAPMRRDIHNVRRVVFRSISLGSLLGADKRLTASKQSVPLAIRDACAQVLDFFADNHAPHYEVLIFANNLHHRLPHATEDMAACIYGLRLRSLAGLGMTDLTISHLEATDPKIFARRVHIIGDVKAAMQYWALGLKANSILHTPDSRQQLFRALSGLGLSNYQMVNSYRGLIQYAEGSKDPDAQPACMETFGEYLMLLGQLGAINTLRKEWDWLSESLKSMDVHTYFDLALDDALKVVGGSDGSDDVKNKSLQDCAMEDYRAIGSRVPPAKESSKKVSWYAVSDD